MEYNSQRSRILLPEYGRAIHAMVQQVLEIEDREKRLKAASNLIQVMSIINPSTKELKETDEIQQKLWDHLYIMSDYLLDVDGPYPMPDRDHVEKRPEKLAYPKHGLAKKHYGRFILEFIDKAKEMEAGATRDAFLEVLGNLMKKAYLQYNQGTVTEELLREHLIELSGGELSFPEGLRFRPSADLMAGIPLAGSVQRAGVARKKKKKKTMGFRPGGRPSTNR
jgi:hypothetical protein